MKLILTLAMAFLCLSYGSAKKETAESPDYIKNYNEGIAAQKKGDYFEAIDLYLKALGEKDDFADAWNNLGFCYRMVAKSYLSESGRSYQNAIKYDPKNEDTIEYQGEYFLLVGQLKAAFANYQTLKGMSSDQAKALKSKLDPILKDAKEILKSYSP
ncbi:MAG: hypothetical protein JSR58_03395 [Verrucomicrobia bacterium]|nr:hypothetical protein [Verrucomicrobiota bacterium]